MEYKKKYIQIKDLEVYRLARLLSKLAWEIYNSLDWQNKKVIGDQFITATDSVGANIAEGYSRFHYLDKIKFFYNARASLSECGDHWIELLFERQKISKEQLEEFKNLVIQTSIKLNNFITVNYKAKKNL